MASVLDATPTRIPMVPMNLHIEFVRPVPLQAFEVCLRIVRNGQKLQIVQASLIADEVETVIATLTRLRQAENSTSLHTPPLPACPPPDSLPRYTSQSPYFEFVDCRPVRGAFNEPGPGTAWMRMLGDVIAGEPPSPLACAMLFADAGSGLASIVPRREWSYPNVSLSLHLHRLPRGEWLLLDSQTSTNGDGVAQVTSVISDASGDFGRAQQALILERTAT